MSTAPQIDDKGKGYFYGKYRVTGQKKYCILCYAVPVVLHTAVAVFLQSADLGRPYLYMAAAAAILFVAAAVVTVCKVLRWQKNKSLDIPVAEQQLGQTGA